MPKPNFFCGIEALQWLLQNEPKSDQDDIDLTVDLIEAPYLFIYSSDAEAWYFKAFSRGELYDHEKGSGVEKGNLRVDKKSGQGSGQTSDPALRDNMGAFFEACRRLSRFIRDRKLQPLYEGLDPEQAGVMLEVAGNKLNARKVSGKERPEMMCTTLFGGMTMCRPYMDDFWDRSETEMMSLEDRIEKAEGGDKFAIAKLATAYLNGDDEVEQDAEKAAYWYRKEADLQDSEGAFNLGLLYAKGFGVERDFTQAAEWMEKAVAWGDPDGAGPAKQYRSMAENLKKAEAGDASAMYELAGGYMALGGSLDQAGSGADYAESLKWAQKAVDAGNADGYWALALAYEHGRGVKTDDKKAVELYKKGAELGSAACRHSYGCRLINGEGVKKDAKAALKLFEQSADQGYGLACKALGHMYETGEGVEPDFDKELAYFEKACEAEPNNAELLRHVGYQYTNLMDDKEKWLHGVERAAYWLRKAAELGDGVAANGLGMYEQILKLHKQGKIKAGTPLDKCMDILSKAAKEEEKRQKEAQQKAERERKEREAAEQKKKEETERAAKKKEADLKAKKEAETIRDTVRRAREEAKSAERAFDRRAAEIERKTSTSLNLYSSDFEPRLREIAQLSVDACRSLYNSYQEQVRRVDKICRPLVNGSRSHGEIKEIAEVIKWLNEESKIENNFSATLNNFNMGNLVQARYSPASDCVSIQRFWENTLKKTPKTAEELQAEKAEKERREKEAAERRKREEEKRRQEEKKRKAEEERKAQEEKRKKAKEEEQFSAFLAVVCRNKDQQEGLSAEEYISRKQAEADSMEELLASSDEAFSMIAAAWEQKNALESEEKNLRTARGEMGIFSFKGKKQIDAKLEENAQKRKQKEEEIAGYVESLGGFETKAQLQTALNDAKKLLRHLKRWGELESDKSAPSLSFSDAVRLYRTDSSVIKRLEDYPWVDAFMRSMLLRGAKTGDMVYLGKYRQNGSKATPIEWRVLSKEGTRLLLISKTILDCHVFQDDLYKNVWRALTVDEMNKQSRKRTWEKCELRQWLNDSFFREAFSAEEQKLIPTVTVPAVKNRINMDHPGHDTRDNVFLLNIPEAEQYFKSNDDRKAEPCKLVADSKTLDWYGGSAWWLRSQGDNNNAFTACVYSDGRIGGTDHFNGGELANKALGIRPCIWIDVEKLEARSGRNAPDKLSGKTDNSG